eukprot:scaffold8_cov249-Pinguiococcus_pyrenoidosus.AAC.27
MLPLAQKIVVKHLKLRQRARNLRSHRARSEMDVEAELSLALLAQPTRPTQADPDFRSGRVQREAVALPEDHT